MTRYFLYLIPFFIVGIVSAEDSTLREISVNTNSLEIKNQSVVNSPQNEQTTNLRSSIFIQFNTSALFASLNDWKNQLYLPDGTHPSSLCMVFGGEIGCAIKNIFELGIGYESFFAPQANATKTGLSLSDQITGSFFYGSLRAGNVLESYPELYLFGGIDVGTLKATESVENYGGMNYNATGNTAAYRLKGGAQYYTSDNWSVTIEGGYLFGKVNNVSVSGQSHPPYTLNLSGIEFRAALNYHIPW